VKKLTESVIRDYKKQLIDFHAIRVKEQKTDQDYYDDKFEVQISDPHQIVRAGDAARIVDIDCSNIDVTNPIIFCEPRKKTDREIERASKKARFLNHWVKQLIGQIEEHKRNNMLRGEAWYQIEFNDSYDNAENSIPFRITAQDPLIIFADPTETGGVPRRVIKSCKMNVGQVEQIFPDWSNPQKRADNGEGVDYLAFWNSQNRFAEADNQAVIPLQKNIFGFVPFVHCYSSFGKNSPEGKPESLVVGRIRKIRGKLRHKCEFTSRLSSNIALYTNPVVKVEQAVENAGEAPTEEELDFGPGKVIVIPYGWRAEIYQGEVPSAETFAYLNRLDYELGLEVPPAAMGMASTSRATGRQEDIYLEVYRGKYRIFLANIERALARALGLGLRIVEYQLKNFPKTTKITLRSTYVEEGKEVIKEELLAAEDIDGDYGCKVEFKPDKELIQDRKIMLYRTLAGEGRVSWKTMLMEGMGYSEDEAEDEIDETLAESAWRTNPELLGMVLTEAMEKSGHGDLLRRLEQDSQRRAGGMGQQMGQMRPSEATNPVAPEILRQVLGESPVGARRSPTGGGM
jgi:hypothetical protein